MSADKPLLARTIEAIGTLRKINELYMQVEGGYSASKCFIVFLCAKSASKDASPKCA